MNPASTNDTIMAEITINAPAERIFEALVNPKQRLQWWGAEYFTGEHMESDLRVGGKWSMRGTALGNMPWSASGEYTEIERPKVLAFTWLPSWPADAKPSVVRFDLDEQNGTTQVRVTQTGATSKAAVCATPQLLAWVKEYAEGTRSD